VIDLLVAVRKKEHVPRGGNLEPDNELDALDFTPSGDLSDQGFRQLHEALGRRRDTERRARDCAPYRVKFND
jgi:hypothetical protein